MSMPQVTIRIPEEQLERLDRMIDRGTFPNRSEAIREAVRNEIDRHAIEERIGGIQR